MEMILSFAATAVFCASTLLGLILQVALPAEKVRRMKIKTATRIFAVLAVAGFALYVGYCNAGVIV